MIKSILYWGLSEGADIKEAQNHKLTSIVGIVISGIFLFYIGYSFSIGSEITALFSFIFLVSSLLALYYNYRGRSGISKNLILGVASFSILFTYNVYNISNAVLTTYFPILLAFTFLFDLKRELTSFYVGLTFTCVTIIFCILLPRHLFYSVEIPFYISLISDKIHILVTLGTTATLLYVALDNKNKVNQDLQQTLDELRLTQVQLIQSEKMATLGVLTAGLNHEIKNPLAHIMGGLGLIKMEDKNKKIEEISELVNAIDMGASRLFEIVNSLNHFNFQSQNLNMKCDLILILENCITILSFKLKNVHLEKNYSNEALYVKGNSGQLHQVFLNIIANAVDAIEERGKLKIWIDHEDQEAIIGISDNGPGMTSEVKNRVFDSFFTTKAPGKGTGLGLPICKKILDDHKGRIHVESSPGLGTTFQITLPLYKDLSQNSGLNKDSNNISAREMNFI